MPYTHASATRRDWWHDRLASAGTMTVGAGKITTGIRVPVASGLREVTVRCGTAPVTSALTGTITKNTSTIVATWSIAAAATIATVTYPTDVTVRDLLDTDILNVDVTAIGSGGAGSNVSIGLKGGPRSFDAR